MSDIARRVAKLSAEKLKLFMQKLSQQDSSSNTQIYPQKRDTTVFPLSFAQQRLWFLYQLEPASTAYLIASVQRFHGIAIDAPVLARSLAELVRRHECLRTTFFEQEEQSVQIIHPAGDFHLPLIDLRALAAEARTIELRRLAEQEESLPCDLMRGPLLRTALLRLDSREHALLLTMHHIVSDGWSHNEFVRELTELYRAFSAGQPSPLPPLPLQYADFAVWQRQWLRDEVLAAQLAYWKSQLAGVTPVELPTDHPRSPMQTYRGIALTVLFPASLHEKLIALSKREDVTLFMLLLAAFQGLLARYTHQSLISLRTAVANRTRPGLADMVCF